MDIQSLVELSHQKKKTEDRLADKRSKVEDQNKESMGSEIAHADFQNKN